MLYNLMLYVNYILIEKLNKVGLEGNFHNMITGIDDKHIVNILNEKD